MFSAGKLEKKRWTSHVSFYRRHQLQRRFFCRVQLIVSQRCRYQRHGVINSSHTGARASVSQVNTDQRELMLRTKAERRVRSPCETWRTSWCCSPSAIFNVPSPWLLINSTLSIHEHLLCLQKVSEARWRDSGPESCELHFRHHSGVLGPAVEPESQDGE